MQVSRQTSESRLCSEVRSRADFARRPTSTLRALYSKQTICFPTTPPTLPPHTATRVFVVLTLSNGRVLLASLLSEKQSKIWEKPVAGVLWPRKVVVRGS